MSSCLRGVAVQVARFQSYRFTVLARLPMGNVFSMELLHMHKNIFSATVNTDNSRLTIM